MPAFSFLKFCCCIALPILALSARVPLQVTTEVENKELDTSVPRGKSFTVYSRPVELEYGQVHNTIQKPIPLPDEVKKAFAGGNMVLTGYKNDVVEFDDEGNVIGSIPLYDCYLHHYGAFLGNFEHLDEFYTELVSEENSNRMEGIPDQEVLLSAYGYTPSRGMNMNQLQSMYNVFLEKKEEGKGKAKSAAGGGGSGAEERKTPHIYPSPYGLSVGAVDSLMPLMHLINTRGDKAPGAGYSPMAECPCSSDRVFDMEQGTIDGRQPIPPFGCNLQLVAEGNPSCALQTYVNGFRCCEHGWFVSEPDARAKHAASKAHYGMKFTFYYAPETPDLRPLRAPACCDVTGNISHGGQVEYDIPQCQPGDSECVHKAVAWQFIDVGRGGFGRKTKHSPAYIDDPNAEIEIVYAVGHQHLGAAPLGISLYLDATNELLCSSKPILGEGTEPGNEKGYVVGMTPCIFGGEGNASPPRLRRSDVVRIESFYDSTNAHYGVMSLWLMQVADVPKESLEQSLVA